MHTIGILVIRRHRVTVNWEIFAEFHARNNFHFKFILIFQFRDILKNLKYIDLSSNKLLIHILLCKRKPPFLFFYSSGDHIVTKFDTVNVIFADYTITKVCPEELHNFFHSLYLGREK